MEPVVPCTYCQRALVPAEILYTADGAITCAACNARADLVRADASVGNNMLNAGIFCVAAAPLGLVAVIFNSMVFWMLGIIVEAFAIFAGLYALRGITRRGDERFARTVKSRSAILATSITGLAIAGAVAIMLTLVIVKRLTEEDKRPRVYIHELDTR